MSDSSVKTLPALSRMPFLLAFFFGISGALINLFPIELAFNISLLIGNTAYIVAASFLRPSTTLICALISVIPLYFYWGHPFGFLTFGLEALFISVLRTRGWYVLSADLLYWLIIGMPLTALLIWINLESAQNYILFSTFKQAINAVLYTSLASIVLFTFNDFFRTIESSHPPLNKSLPKWLLYSFWSVSAFLVISISLALSTEFDKRQKDLLINELKTNSIYLKHIGNSYLDEHQRAISNIANQLSNIVDTNQRHFALSQLHALYPGFSTMLVASDKGKIELASPRSLMEKQTFKNLWVDDRPYFIHAMFEQKLYTSSVFLGRGFGADPIVAISAPLYAAGKEKDPSGIVEGSLNLSNFGQYDTEGHDKNNIKIIVTDQEDLIIYASKSLGFSTLSKLKYDSNASQKVPNLISLRVGENKGEMFLYSQTRLDNGWKVYSLINHQVALKITEDMYLVIFITLFIILLFASFFAKHLSQHLNRPLAFVLEQILNVKKARDFKDIPYDAPNEIQKLYQELKKSKQALLNNQEELQAQVLKQTEKLNLANKKLIKQVNTDTLTTLYNRRYFEKSFISMQSLLSRSNSNLSFMLLDIDFFKKLNDTHGHLFGDYCLIELADILKTFFHRETDLVARIGGEEFVIVSPYDDINIVKSRAEKLCQTIADFSFINDDNKVIRITASIGIAAGNANFSNKQSNWFSIADKCLYQAKKNGRNQICLEEVSV